MSAELKVTGLPFTTIQFKSFFYSEASAAECDVADELEW